jgi:hypothetical protein
MCFQLEALKEEKRNLVARRKEEDRLMDEKLLPFKNLRKEVLTEVEVTVCQFSRILSPALPFLLLLLFFPVPHPLFKAYIL